MTLNGGPVVVADYPAVMTWDGRRLPGQWLTLEAIAQACSRARTQGTCTVVIRRSHHLAALASYLKRVTEKGLMIVLTCSDPFTGAVAPHGGRTGVMTPNPFAAAWPTEGEPVMIDMCQSITTNLMTRRFHTEGRRFPGPWVMDAEGNPTDDPAVMFASPPGAFLPNGGADHGHKGYAMGLWVEALTAGLSGHGRADPKEGWGSTTFVQVLDPALFGGRAEFERQTRWLANACRATPPRPGVARVRLPGEQGLHLREEQLRAGVRLYPAVMPALAQCAQALGLSLPAALPIS